jgi:hypothetical protein
MIYNNSNITNSSVVTKGKGFSSVEELNKGVLLALGAIVSGVVVGGLTLLLLIYLGV